MTAASAARFQQGFIRTTALTRTDFACLIIFSKKQD
jgi:hypothetical protein